MQKRKGENEVECITASTIKKIDWEERSNCFPIFVTTTFFLFCLLFMEQVSWLSVKWPISIPEQISIDNNSHANAISSQRVTFSPFWHCARCLQTDQQTKPTIKNTTAKKQHSFLRWCSKQLLPIRHCRFVGTTCGLLIFKQSEEGKKKIEKKGNRLSYCDILELIQCIIAKSQTIN